MKIVIAPDSFKESLDAASVARAIRNGLAEVWPDAHYVLKPMADGGEGTVDAVLASTRAERRINRVSGPLGDPVDACCAWEAKQRIATLEIAEASGLMRLAEGTRDAAKASSFGTGELIRAALDVGAERIVLGLGGSATNDGGTGLLQALGVRFLDAQGAALPPGGLALEQLARIDSSGLDPRCAHVHFDVASDVINPLCGPAGASHVFGAQKGADKAMIFRLDTALGKLADAHVATGAIDHRQVPGAGAAGGAGWALLAILNARMQSGVSMIAALNGLSEAVRDADWVITGEGRMDAQTLGGKVPFGVARIAASCDVPVLALVGTLGNGYEKLYEHGICAAFSLTPGPMSLTTAMRDAASLLQQRARDIALLIKASGRQRN